MTTDSIEAVNSSLHASSSFGPFSKAIVRVRQNERTDLKGVAVGSTPELYYLLFLAEEMEKEPDEGPFHIFRFDSYSNSSESSVWAAGICTLVDVCIRPLADFQVVLFAAEENLGESFTSVRSGLKCIAILAIRNTLWHHSCGHRGHSLLAFEDAYLYVWTRTAPFDLVITRLQLRSLDGDGFGEMNRLLDGVSCEDAGSKQQRTSKQQR